MPSEENGDVPAKRDGESLEETLEGELAEAAEGAEVRHQRGGNPFVPPEQPEEVSRDFEIDLPAQDDASEPATLTVGIMSTRADLDLTASCDADQLDPDQYRAYMTFVEAILAN